MTDYINDLEELIDNEEEFMDRVYEQLQELDEGRAGNPALERIYAGLFKAYKKAEKALESLNNLLRDIDDLLAGRRVEAFAAMPQNRREAIAAYAVAAGHNRKPSVIYATCVAHELRCFLEREAAAVLMDPNIPDQTVLQYMEHLARSMPSLSSGGALSSDCAEAEKSGASWGEKLLWTAVGVAGKSIWDSYSSSRQEKQAKELETK